MKVILDCDNTMGLPFKEIDDGLTLLYLLGRPDVELLGVTTTFGNGTVEQAYQQTQALLRRVGRSVIPVWKGQAKPGELPNDAASFLVRAVSAVPGEITLLATGPLTNLQAAFRLDGSFFTNVRQVACMGGYIDPLRIGWRDLAELNLSADPRASFTVLNAPCPIALMSAQLCLQASFGWIDLKQIHSLAPWLRKTILRWLLVFGLYFSVPRFYLWDLLPAVYLSYPELFDSRQIRFLSTEKDLAEGKIRFQHENGKTAGINLPANILDPERLKRMIFDGWKAVSLTTK